MWLIYRPDNGEKSWLGDISREEAELPRSRFGASAVLYEFPASKAEEYTRNPSLLINQRPGLVRRIWSSLRGN